METSKLQRKTKIVGTRELMDTKTGELIPVQEISVEERDFNFHKVWLSHLIQSLDEISNQKQRLAYWIIDNLDRENKLTMTQRQIAAQSGLSYQTVNRTMSLLKESGFLVQITIGAYMVNPAIVWKGTHNARMGILYDYSKYVSEQSTRSEQGNRKEQQNVESTD